MANVKKNVETEEAMTNDSVVVEQKTKTSAPSVDQSDEIAALKAQIEMLTKMMAKTSLSFLRQVLRPDGGQA